MDNHSGQYNDSNRAFLQAFLARGTMTYEESKPILAEIFSVDGERSEWLSHTRLTFSDGRQMRPQDVSEADFNSYVTAANDAISAFDFSIRSSLSQHDRTRIFALVNTTSDPITQLATTHTADEVAYLKRLLDAMFEMHNTPRQEIMAVTSMQAVRLHKADGHQRQDAAGAANGETQTTGTHSLTMASAEKVLKDLVREGWFEKSRAGFFTLSPRALIELKHYLLTTYNVSDEDDDQEEADERQDRIKLCAACKEIVTIASLVDPGVLALLTTT